ncbi:MAG: prenyltransferase/squalene oxidase repeat-containing protein [Planctomycetota bacterium]|jgi:prenyltransferase beta subunit
MATSTDLRAAIEEVQQQLPAEQMEGMVDVYDQDWATKVQQRVGALPWWVISAVVHAVIFLLATLLTVALPPAQVDEVIISTDVVQKEEQKYDENKQRDIFRNQNEIKHEKQIEKPILYHEEAPMEEQFQTDNDMDQNTARGHEDAISDIPLGGTGVTGSMGVGGGGMAGCFGYRDGGGRKRAIGRFGGSPATESAVEAALQWLKRHQESEGYWDVDKWEGGNVVQGNLLRGARQKSQDISITGLATLAFLGAGYTHKSGKFKDNVHRAVNWLASKQLPSGGFGFEGYGKSPLNGFQIYDHAIGTLALAEAYGMSRDPVLREPAQKGVDNLVKLQASYGAWQHGGTKSMSVTGWVIMALKSAKVAGLRVDGSAFQGAHNWIQQCHDKKFQGMITYSPRVRAYWGRGYVTTAAGAVCKQFMGVPNTDASMKANADFLLKEVPTWIADAHAKKTCQWPYYWYYGTLAMFQMGGNHWAQWNTAMKKTLVPNQRKGGPLDGSKNDVDGSWDCDMGFGPTGGRAYTTAVNALSLEVYYRYLPMYTK